MPSATLRLIAALRTTRPRLYSASQPLTLCLRCSSSASSTALTPNAQLTNLEARGLLRDVTSRSVHAHLNEAKRTVYLGVDPSAPSLHVGNLLPIMALLHLILAGHRAILLVGGATGSIGDPSGRSKERNALDAMTLQRNVNSIRSQIDLILSNIESYLQQQKQRGGSNGKASSLSSGDEGGQGLRHRVQVLNNAEWYRGVGILDFLTTVGRFARMSDMLARESVSSRLNPKPLNSSGGEESAGAAAAGPVGMSFTEFSYQLLQAYDFQVLHSGEHRCSLQLGGSDQLGNIMAGVELILRTRSAAVSGGGQGSSTNGLAGTETKERGEQAPAPAYGITVPLLTTSSGAKFGKSAGNAVWLSSTLLSDYDFFQYFWRSSDGDVEKFLKTLTLLSMEEIEEIMIEHNRSPGDRFAQRRLATELTAMVRGAGAVQRANKAQQILFSEDPKRLKAEEVVDALQHDSRLVRLDRDQVVGSDLLTLCVSAKATPSRGEARRLVQNGGIYLNDIQMSSPTYKLDESHLIDNGRLCILRRGKADHRVILIG